MASIGNPTSSPAVVRTIMPRSGGGASFGRSPDHRREVSSVVRVCPLSAGLIEVRPAESLASRYVQAG